VRSVRTMGLGVDAAVLRCACMRSVAAAVEGQGPPLTGSCRSVCAHAEVLGLHRRFNFRALECVGFATRNFTIKEVARERASGSPCNAAETRTIAWCGQFSGP
jgi:hypothetical protein